MARAQKQTINDDDAPPFVWMDEAKRRYRVATALLAEPNGRVPADMQMQMVNALLQASIAASQIAYNDMIGRGRA